MKRWTLFIVIALLLLSLACSFGGASTPVPDNGGGTQATQESSTNGGATAEPPSPSSGNAEDNGGEEGGMPDISAEELKGLDSYRLSITFNATSDSGEVTEQGEILMEETRDPRAYRMVIKDLGNEGEEMEVIVIGQDQWMRMGDSWIHSQIAPEDVDEFGNGLVLSPDDLLSEISTGDYEYVGKEKVNGVKTKHYRHEMSADEAAGIGDMASIESGVVDVWVADEHGIPEIPIKILITVKGEIENGVPGTATVDMEITDINANITIEPPADAGDGSIAGLPDYPNAQNLASFGDMISFQTDDDVETVQSFYEEALSQAGWSKGDSSVMEGLVMEDWTKDGQTLSLMITAEESGGCSVLLTIGE